MELSDENVKGFRDALEKDLGKGVVESLDDKAIRHIGNLALYVSATTLKIRKSTGQESQALVHFT